MTDAAQLFTPECLDNIFPPSLTDSFFEALFGGAEEGAYDIRLRYDSATDSQLNFEFHLIQRPGRCLACNLTYGLPQVFSRHPMLAVGKIAQTLCERSQQAMDSWKLGGTREISRSLHIIPFTITLA